MAVMRASRHHAIAAARSPSCSAPSTRPRGGVEARDETGVGEWATSTSTATRARMSTPRRLTPVTRIGVYQGFVTADTKRNRSTKAEPSGIRYLGGDHLMRNPVGGQEL